MMQSPAWVTPLTSRLSILAHASFMLGVGLIAEFHDSIATAEGRCQRCGAYFNVTVPDDRSAAEALLAIFNKHLAEKHAEEEKGDDSCTFPIAG